MRKSSPYDSDLRPTIVDRELAAKLVASVNVVEIGVGKVATVHAAMVATWVGTASMSGGVNSAMGSVCM